MKHLWVILLSLFLLGNVLSCKKNNIDKKISLEKPAKIKKAFLTLNFGDSKKVVNSKLKSLYQDGNIRKAQEFKDKYKFLFEINKYGIEYAMAYINPFYYEDKLFKVELNIWPFESKLGYEKYLKKYDIMIYPDGYEKIERFRNLHLAINQLYIKKYGQYDSQIESEARGIFNRYWSNDNLRINIEIFTPFVNVEYIDNDTIELIKRKKINTNEAI